MTQEELNVRLDQFISQYNGKPADFDKAYGDQCVDLVQFYNKEVFNGPFLSGNAAFDIANTYPKTIYRWVQNTPDAVPTKGSVIIWGRDIGQWGHIAIFVRGDVISFTSFDQNWPVGDKCKLVGHNYYGVLGWLQPILEASHNTNSNTVPMNEQDKKDVESMRKLREYNGVWYEAKDVVADFEKLKDQIKNFKPEVKEVVVTKEVIKEVVVPKKYKSPIASFIADFADFLETKEQTPQT